VEQALAKFQSPDPYSRSQAHEGRRIVPIERGWKLLNHGVFRDLVDAEGRRTYHREYKRRRAQMLKSTKSNSSTEFNPSDADADTESDPDSKPLAGVGVESSTLPEDPDLVSTIPDLDQQTSGHHDGLRSKTRSRGRARGDYSETFLAFWAVYPKKVGKGAAWQMWSIHKPVFSDVMDALSWQLKTEQWTRDGGRYVPYPATYLSQRRWQDEPPTQSPAHLTKSDRQRVAIYSLKEYISNLADTRKDLP
jgi:hypothetical protein